MRKKNKASPEPTGLQLGSALLAEIEGFDRLSAPKQAAAFKALRQELDDCPTFQNSVAANEIVLVPFHKGVCVVFKADPVGPLKCAAELLTRLEKCSFRCRMAGHVGAFQVTETPEGKLVAAGDLLSSLEHASEEGKAGQVVVTEQLAEIARQTPEFADRLRHIPREHEEGRRLYRLGADDDRLELSSGTLKRWQKLAVKFHSRASAKDGSEPAPVREIAERLAALYRDAKVAAVIVFFAYLLHLWSEDTDAGRRLQLWAYQKLESSVAAPVNELPVTVVDFGKGLEKSDADGSTNMSELADLISAIAKRGPAAIGVDLDFGPLADQTFPQDEEKVVQIAQTLTDQKIPVYLTVHRSIWLTPDAWLGDPKYAHLVAHPLVPIEPLTGQITLFDSLPVPHASGQQATVPSMSNQLAAAIQPDPKQRSTSWAQFVGNWVVKNLATPYAVSDLVNQQPTAAAPPSLGKKYYVNFSALPRLKQETIRAATPQALDSYGDIDNRIKGAAVLVGSSAPNPDGGFDDEWDDPTTGQKNPGVYLLALGTDTRAEAPLYEFTEPVRQWLTILISCAVVSCVILIRLLYIASPKPVGESRLSIFITAALAILTLVGGVLMVRMLGILWPDFFLIAFLLMLHPRIEHTLIHSWKWIVRSSKQAWEQIVFGEK